MLHDLKVSLNLSDIEYLDKNISKKSRKSILVKSTMNIEYVTYYITLPSISQGWLSLIWTESLSQSHYHSLLGVVIHSFQKFP